MGGKSATALYTNLFDAAGFTVSAIWNPWASACAKRGDFATVLYSQALSPELTTYCLLTTYYLLLTATVLYSQALSPEPNPDPNPCQPLPR